MFINTKVAIFVYLIYNNITNITCKTNFRRSNWLGHAIRDIKHEHKMFQTMLIFNQNASDSRIQEIVYEIGRNFKTMGISYQSLTEKQKLNLSKMTSLKSPRDTTMFIIIETSEDAIMTKAEEAISFIKQITGARIRPKCLVIYFSGSEDNSKLEKFLYHTWSNQFLDVSVLKIHKDKEKKEVLVPTTADENPTLHNIDPFNNAYTKQEYSSRIQLFPNKLLNMNRYKLKVGIFNRPPYTFVKRNSVGYPIETSGPDFLISKILSEKMNFKIIFPPSFDLEEHYGSFNCIKNKTTGLIHQLTHNQIQLIGVRSIHIASICPSSGPNIAILGLVNFVTVVPILRRSDPIMWVGSTFLYITISTCTIVTIIYTLAHCLKFDKRIWMFPNIVQAILSLTIPELPQELKERILFGCVFIISIGLSTDIYSAMTDFHYQSETEIEFSTLKAVDESSLQLIVENNLVELIRGFDDQPVVNMFKESIYRAETTEKCFVKMAQQNTFACFSRRKVAKMLIEQYKDNQGKPMMKLVPEILFATVEGFLLEPGSPYADRFNVLISKIIQSGVFSKLEEDSLRKSTIRKTEVSRMLEEINSQSVKIPILLGVVIGGFTLSMFVFVGELLMVKFLKRGLDGK